MLRPKKLNRQQRRVEHKLTGQELEDIKRASTMKGISYTVEVFEKVMNEEFGFGDKRMGRVAEGIYRELGLNPEDL